MFTFDVQPQANVLAEKPALIWFCQEGPGYGYCIALWPDRAELRKRAPSGLVSLAHTALPQRIEKSIDLAIQRKRTGLCVALGERFLFRCPDKDFSSKITSVQCVGASLQASLRRIQPLGDIYFTDDFMRTQSGGLWQPASGNWHLCALQIPERSANPFSLFARFANSPPQNPLFTGRTRRYVGIGIRTERKDGLERIIYVFENTPAWTAGLRLGDVITAVDGVPIAKIPEEELPLRVMGNPGTPVRLTVRRLLDGVEKEMEFVARRQQIDLDRIEDLYPLSSAPLSDSAFIFAGYPFWSQYRMAVSAKPLGEGEFGLVFYRRDDQNYCLFKWASDGPLTLLKVVAGKEQILAQREGGFAPGQYYRMEVAVHDTRITARIDGVPVLVAEDKEALWGQVGLYAARSRGVYFDDVLVASVDRDLDLQAKPLGPLFENDTYMKEWAGTEADWLEVDFPADVPWRWNKFAFPGEARIEVKRFFGERLMLTLNAARQAAADGYVLDLKRSEARGSLSRNGVLLQHIERISPYFSSVAFGLNKGQLIVNVDSREVLRRDEPHPLHGDRVGIGGDIGGLDLSSVTVASTNVMDETFTYAPVNWQIAGGLWGVMNRWVCDPRWSWFGGRSKGIAAIWSKWAFYGDVTVDAFIAMEMPSYWKSPHENAADFGVTICGDGHNLSSGYTLLLGAHHNTRTLLYRRDRIVAQTSSPLFLFPLREQGEEEGLELHRGWLHVTLQKRGSRIIFFLGGMVGLEFNDPEPLDGGRVAFWTVNNGLLIARARIAYARPHPPNLLLKEYTEFSDPLVTNAGRDGEITAAVSKPAPDAPYTVTNLHSGGHFALYLRQHRVNLSTTPLLKLEYKMPSSAKVDLYFDYEGDRHRLLLQPASKRVSDDTVAVTVGSLPQARSADEWHCAEFPLLDAMKSLYPYKTSFVIENVALANYDNTGYLLAGFGGNRKGTSYQLRRLEFCAPPKEPHSVAVSAVEFPFQSPQNHSRIIWHLTSARTIDFSKLAASVNERRFDSTHPAWRCRPLERIVEVDLPTAGFTLKDGDVLRVALLQADRPLHLTEWRFRLSDDRYPPQNIRIAFGRPNFLDYDFERDIGDCYPVGAQHKTMPGPMGGWLRRQIRSRGAYEDFCLRVQNKRMGHDFGLGFLKRACDVGRYPILSFDYRLPHGLSVDISYLLLKADLAGNAQRQALQWATQSFRQDLRAYTSYPTVAVLSKPKQDGEWHHADINIFKKLKEYDPTRTEYIIRDLHIADDVCGYLGNYEGVSFWVDNIKLRPLLNANTLRPKWTASDISGISDYRCAFNPDPNHVPTSKTTPQDIAALRDGPTYFHLSLCDGAGNWSPPVHELVYLDVTPPEVAYFAPVPELEGTFDIRFIELVGLDPTSLLLKVGTREYRVDGKHMWYDQVRQILTFRALDDLSGLVKQASHSANGTPEVSVTLLRACDFADNQARTPQSWVWQPQLRQLPQVPPLPELILPPPPIPK